MKKWFALFGLIALIIWGAYDIQSKENSRLVQKKQAEHTVEEEQQESEIGLNQGELAPDFTLLTTDGEGLSLSDYRGKRVIVNLWATWCSPCIAEMPHLQSFYSDYQDEGLELIAINLTESEAKQEDIHQFIDKYQLTFPIVFDKGSEVADLYQVTTIPTTFILNSKGEIEQKIVGPMTYEIIEELMQQVQ
ncbi:redoxin domain-containing protein [Paenibacillus tritici]|uniref:redoxin domain-containing protein n=1 Tax=Paenibacillus tritici TaxID=1873425 RepID=UPI001BA7698A|nr:redoxin domain-containing protein [Paenibacillus tritici]QUL53501.1 redoxin domain-containing protein [Paenibacillus tritici]